MAYRRFAIYYAPPAEHPLGRFGAAWLGWDAASGVEVAHPDLGLDAARLTATPRKYGFHGTLKPPMRLVGTPEAFEDAARALAADVAAFEMPPLTLRAIGPFLALVPAEPSRALAALAARCVMELDQFRAPPSEAELAKRRQQQLSPAQEALLARWGYPKVLEEFRFPLTRTGALEAGDLARATEALAPALEAPLAEPLPVREICLFGEAKDGRFHIVTRLPLAG
ncbi:MAG: DUF1045 domain-containing protein [Pseudomonadota bacterium]